jgi:hypothetical protein
MIAESAAESAAYTAAQSAAATAADTTAVAGCECYWYIPLLIYINILIWYIW